MIGPRLIGTSADGRDQAALTMVSLEGTYLSKKTRIAVDKILEWSRTDRPAPPDGLEFALTGSAVVGHDTNRAANESINNTTNTTVALVVLILLVVYRSPLLAMVPLVTIALSVFVSLRMIALLTTVPGLGFQVINITQGLRGGGPLWRGHRLLPVPDRALFRGASPRKVEDRRPPRSHQSGRRGPGRQRRYGDRRAGDALFLELRQGSIHRADDRSEPGRLADRRLDARPGDAGLAGRCDLLAVPRPPSRQRREIAKPRAWKRFP